MFFIMDIQKANNILEMKEFDGLHNNFNIKI